MKTTIVILVLVLLPGSVWAQDTQDPLFQRVTQNIHNARELLRVYPNEAAAALVNQAQAALQEALQLANNRQIRLAQLKLRTANDLIERALNMLNKVPTARTQEEIEELIRRAETLLATNRNQEAERLLNNAKDHLRQAKIAVQSNQAQPSLEHFRLAKFFAERCCAMLNNSKTGPGFDLENEKRQYEELLQKTRDAVGQCNNRRAQRLLAQAQVQTDNIAPLLQRGEVRLALNLYDNATRLLLRALDLCAGLQLSERDQLIEEQELLADQIAQTQETARHNIDANQQQILSKVLALKMQISQAVEAGQYGIALRKIELARTLLNRVWSPGPHLDATRTEQQRLLQEIERCKTDPAPMSPRAQSLLQAAERNAFDASNHLQQGRIRLALFSILAGNRFLTLAKNTQTEAATITSLQVENELQKIRDDLSMAAARAPEDDETLEHLRLAGRLADRAGEALGNGHLEIAREYIKMADNILQRTK